MKKITLLSYGNVFAIVVRVYETYGWLVETNGNLRVRERNNNESSGKKDEANARKKESNGSFFERHGSPFEGYKALKILES